MGCTCDFYSEPQDVEEKDKLHVGHRRRGTPRAASEPWCCRRHSSRVQRVAMRARCTRACGPAREVFDELKPDLVLNLEHPAGSPPSAIHSCHGGRAGPIGSSRATIPARHVECSLRQATRHLQLERSRQSGETDDGSRRSTTNTSPSPTPRSTPPVPRRRSVSSSRSVSERPRIATTVGEIGLVGSSDQKVTSLTMGSMVRLGGARCRAQIRMYSQAYENSIGTGQVHVRSMERAGLNSTNRHSRVSPFRARVPATRRILPPPWHYWATC